MSVSIALGAKRSNNNHTINVAVAATATEIDNNNNNDEGEEKKNRSKRNGIPTVFDTLRPDSICASHSLIAFHWKMTPFIIENLILLPRIQ